jgi:hypothetical protein
MYLEQSDYPPGCEKEPVQLRFAFSFRGDPAMERKTVVEFTNPNTFKITVNPLPRGAPGAPANSSNSAERSVPAPAK